jgi:4-carboxymuconolactone decarboxylase
MEAVFAQIRARGGEPSPLYRTLAHAPKMLAAWAAIAWPLRHQPSVPRLLRELMVMRIAQLTGASYEWAYHWGQAIAAGVSEEQLRLLAEWRASDAFSDEERLVIAYAEAVTRLAVDDDLYAAVARRFNPAEIVELTLTAAFYTNVSRFLQALQVGVDQAHEPFLPG